MGQDIDALPILEKPVALGWYWFMEDGDNEALVVELGNDGTFMVLGSWPTYSPQMDHKETYVKYLPGQWIGPLKVPVQLRRRPCHADD